MGVRLAEHTVRRDIDVRSHALMSAAVAPTAVLEASLSTKWVNDTVMLLVALAGVLPWARRVKWMRACFNMLGSAWNCQQQRGNAWTEHVLCQGYTLLRCQTANCFAVRPQTAFLSGRQRNCCIRVCTAGAAGGLGPRCPQQGLDDKT